MKLQRRTCEGDQGDHVRPGASEEPEDAREYATVQMMSIPADHEWLFWEVDPDAIDLPRDRRYVLGRVLERGRLSDVRWVVSEYGFDGIDDFFRAGAHPEISRATRAMWRAFFGERAQAWPIPPSWRNDSAAPWIG